MLNCLFFRIFSPFIKVGTGFCPTLGIWQGAGTPATSQMRCWLLRRHKLHILRFRAERESSSIPLRLLSKSQSRCWIAILFFCTSAQRWLLRRCRAHTRRLGGKPHTAATRGSRRAPGIRHTRRVDCADLFHGRKIGTIGTFERNPPFAVAAVGICQNSVFS